MFGEGTIWAIVLRPFVLFAGLILLWLLSRFIGLFIPQGRVKAFLFKKIW